MDIAVNLGHFPSYYDLELVRLPPELAAFSRKSIPVSSLMSPYVTSHDVTADAGADRAHHLLPVIEFPNVAVVAQHSSTLQIACSPGTRKYGTSFLACCRLVSSSSCFPALSSLPSQMSQQPSPSCGKSCQL